MSQRTGEKRAGLAVASSLAVAILSACMVPAQGVEPSSSAAPTAVVTPAAEPVPVASATSAEAPSASTPGPNTAASQSATASPGAAAIDATRIAAGRELFNGWGCSACHTLADAKATGVVGPSLDGNASLTEEFIIARVTNGQGAMPAFGGQLTAKEIADVAYYITRVSKK